MSIVKHTDPKSGTVYVYESTSYWDKEKKQPRSKRKLIGKEDADGNTIPTGKKGRRKISQSEVKEPRSEAGRSVSSSTAGEKDIQDILAEKDEIIRALKAENRELRSKRQQMLTEIRALAGRWADGEE